MPLLGNGEYREPNTKEIGALSINGLLKKPLPARRQSQHSGIAKSAMSHRSPPSSEASKLPEEREEIRERRLDRIAQPNDNLSPAPMGTKQDGMDNAPALSDTPATTAPNSPIM